MKHLKRYYCTAIIITIFFALPALAQVQLDGRVTDAQSGEPLHGATILIEETSEGTTTDRNGLFSIPVGDELPSLSMSYIGYETVTRQITDAESFLDIKLEPQDVDLSELVVTAFHNNRSISEVAGGITSLQPAQIQRYDNSNLQLTLNSVPGVRMESTAPGGSTRISIRGSLLRSPWGVRGIKAYWNGLPLTDAGGSTPYDVFDPAILDNLEILKGPSGSIYGAGTGGVMLFNSSPQGSPGYSVNSGFSTGSFGLTRYTMNAGFGNSTARFRIGYTDQEYAGYRPNQSTSRRLLNMTGTIVTGERGFLSFYGYQVAEDFYLPGNLTLEEYQEAPRQSLPFAIENETRRESESANLGASYEYDIMDNVTANAALYVRNSSIPDHPNGTNQFSGGYFIGNTRGTGGRATVTYSATPAGIQSMITVGTEFQRDRGSTQTYGVADARPVLDDLQEITEMTIDQHILFAQMELDLPYDIIVTAGGSLNTLTYDLDDLLNPDEANQSGIFSTNRKLAPRFSAVKKLTGDFSLHGSISYGFSPPGRNEIYADGRVNAGLLPENGLNYEAGFRGNLFSRMHADVSGYIMELDNIILRRGLESGSSVYENAGVTLQRGVEAALNFTLFGSADRFFRPSGLWVNYTWNHYTFRDYQEEDSGTGEVMDYSGNRIPGVSPHVISSGLDFDTHPGFYGNVNVFWFDDRYITNANTVVDEGYSLINVKLGYRFTLAGALELDIHAGIENIRNVKYVGTLGVNGFGGRYYNLGTPRSVYSGFNVTYNF